MSNSNGKITKPVDVRGDVAMVLSNGIISVAASDVAALCSHANINPASKRKPIRYPSYEDLLPADFKGTSEDNNNGIYYGVRLGTKGNVNFKDLHSETLTYYRPRPGTDWCRITDFDGYDHKAKFNPEGRMGAYTYDSAISMPVNIDYYDTNTTGISIEDLLPDSDATRLKDYYPCVLLSEGSGTIASVWARALSTKEDSYATSKLHNGSAYISQWYIPLKNTDNNGKGSSGSAKTIAELLATKYFTVTIFFVRGITAAAFGSDLSKWTDLGGTAGALQKGLVCPNAAGMKLEIKAIAGAAGVEVVSVSVFKKKTFVGLAWVNPTVGRTYRVTLRVTRQSDGTVCVNTYKDFTVASNWADTMPSMTVPDQVSDFAAGSYTFSWTTVRTDTSQQTASGSGSFTVS